MIETTLDIEQSFDGVTLELDAFQAEDGEGYFQFGMALSRLSDFGAPSTINIGQENLFEQKGSTFSNSNYINGLTVIENNSFTNRYGIILRDAGNYSLGGQLNDQGISFPLNNYFRAENIIVDIYSTLDPSFPSGNFEFEVVD